MIALRDAHVRFDVTRHSIGFVFSSLHCSGVKEVVLTDMGATMDILRKNVKENTPASGSLAAEELEWYAAASE